MSIFVRCEMSTLKENRLHVCKQYAVPINYFSDVWICVLMKINWWLETIIMSHSLFLSVISSTETISYFGCLVGNSIQIWPISHLISRSSKEWVRASSIYTIHSNVTFSLLQSITKEHTRQHILLQGCKLRFMNPFPSCPREMRVYYGNIDNLLVMSLDFIICSSVTHLLW